MLGYNGEQILPQSNNPAMNIQLQSKISAVGKDKGQEEEGSEPRWGLREGCPEEVWLEEDLKLRQQKW